MKNESSSPFYRSRVLIVCSRWVELQYFYSYNPCIEPSAIVSLHLARDIAVDRQIPSQVRWVARGSTVAVTVLYTATVKTSRLQEMPVKWMARFTFWCFNYSMSPCTILEIVQYKSILRPTSLGFTESIRVQYSYFYSINNRGGQSHYSI